MTETDALDRLEAEQMLRRVLKVAEIASKGSAYKEKRRPGFNQVEAEDRSRQRMYENWIAAD